MKHAWTIVRVAGTDVRLHWSFPLLFVWVALFGSSLGLPRGAILSTMEVMIVMCVFVVAHELGHVLMAQRFGINGRDVTLTPLGAMATLDRPIETARAEVLIALAGPGVSLLMAAACLVAADLIGDPDYFDATKIGTMGIFGKMFWGNLLLAALNLLPAWPLDGGKALAALMRGPLGAVRATRWVGYGSVLVAIGFCILGAVSDPMLFGAAAFVIWAARRENQSAAALALVRDPVVADAATWEFGYLTEELPIVSLLDYAITHPQRDFPVMRQDVCVGIITRDDILRGVRGGREARTVGQEMQVVFAQVQLADPLRQAVEKMRHAGVRILPVLDPSGAFAGLVKWDEAFETSLLQEAQNEAVLGVA